MNDIDTQLRLNDLRLRILNKSPVSAEEMREVLDNLRAGRISALRAEKKAARQVKNAVKQAKVEEVDLGTLFGE